MFSFRIRFNRSITSEINEESNEIVVPIDQQRSIALRAPAADATIRTSEQLVLVGEGYASADEAAAAAETFQHALMIALARVRVGADFGRRAPKGEFTQYGLSEAGRNTGRRTLNNVHGVLIYESEPKPQFVGMNVRARWGIASEMFQTALRQAVKLRPSLAERELLAMTFFNSLFFEASADARFVLLVIAVETLLEPPPGLALRKNILTDSSSRHRRPHCPMMRSDQ